MKDKKQLDQQQIAGQDKKNSKKRKKAPIIIAAVLVLGFFASLSNNDSASTATSTSSSPNIASSTEAASSTVALSPEEVKKAAEVTDLNIARPVWIAKQYWENINERMGGLDTGETDLLDLYSYCNDAADFMLEQVRAIDDVEDENAQAYKDAAASYISVVWSISSDLVKYIDNLEMETLDKVKENISLLSIAESEFNDARTEYLTAAGFTEEEIANRPSVSE